MQSVFGFRMEVFNLASKKISFEGFALVNLLFQEITTFSSIDGMVLGYLNLLGRDASLPDRLPFGSEYVTRNYKKGKVAHFSPVGINDLVSSN